jgi:hypothetical protein
VARRTELIVHRTCDLCALGDGRDVEATGAYVVALDVGERARSRPRLVDVCTTHRTQLDVLRELVTGVTAYVDEPAKTGRPMSADTPTVECPVCGKAYARKHVIVHVRKQHAQNVTVEQPDVCPDCGLRLDGIRMAGHRARDHGWDALAAYVDAARTLGQPALPVRATSPERR